VRGEVDERPVEAGVRGEDLAVGASGFGVEKLVKGRLGLDFEDQSWPEKVEIESVEKKSVNETWTQSVGIQKTYHDVCSEYTVKLKGDFPKLHETLEYQNFRFELVEMDEHRISKIKVIIGKAS